MLYSFRLDNSNNVVHLVIVQTIYLVGPTMGQMCMFAARWSHPKATDMGMNGNELMCLLFDVFWK